MIEVLVNEHMQFGEEHRQLLKAQVLMHDSMQKMRVSRETMHTALEKIAQAQAASELKLVELAEAQKHTDERMAALILTVDEQIRRPRAQ